MQETLDIYIGFDEVESVAYHTLSHSILSRASMPVAIHPVKRSLMPFYTRQRDPRQSNDFSFTRFLVPYMNQYTGWALFMDCDMLVRTDIKELFDQRDLDKAVMVCKHDYTPKLQTKYLGNVQYPYPKKNWSSVMLFNCAHFHTRRLTPEYVNTATGLELHQMKWTEESRIGDLPLEWNWLVEEYPFNSNAKNVHFTNFGPWLHGHEQVDYAEEWYIERSLMTQALQEKKHDTTQTGTQ